jgi:RNA polymerase sigma factor (sigma-70 family)
VAQVTEHGTRTNVELLGLTQEFLRNELGRQAPDSLLGTAWDEFYRVYNELLRRFALARGVRGADVDDCLQEVWFEIARSLAEFEHPRDRPGLRAWLYTVVRSKANDMFRRSTRRQADSLDVARQAGAEPMSPATEPGSTSTEEWERALLETVLDELRSDVSEENRKLLQMRLVDRRDVAEVAAELGISPEQVWYRQHRLLKKLKARMALFTGEQFGGDDATQ